MPGPENPKQEDAALETVRSMEPTLQACILCDLVAKVPGGKFAYIGVFDRFLRLGPIPQFFIVLKWVNGLGSHCSSIRVLHPDLKPLFEAPKSHPMTLKQRTDVATAQFGFVNFTFSRAGVHWVQVLLNGEGYSSIPLPVFDVR